MLASLRDRTTGEVLVPQLELAETRWARFRGLMLRRSLPAGSGMLIRPCMSIHMFFMWVAIDVVFIDAQGRVTRVVRGLRPWMGFAWGGRHARAAVELPMGVGTRFNKGQTIEVVGV